MIFEGCIFHSVTQMKTDFIPTVTRRQGCLTFAMKKRPTSGYVTYIRTLHDDVIPSGFKDVMVLVVLNIFILYSHCRLEIKNSNDNFIILYIYIIMFCHFVVIPS